MPRGCKSALMGMLDIKQFHSAGALGDWLHRIGNKPQILQSLISVNQGFLRPALDDCKAVALDIDVSEMTANKRNAKRTYKPEFWIKILDWKGHPHREILLKSRLLPLLNIPLEYLHEQIIAVVL